MHLSTGGLIILVVFWLIVGMWMVWRIHDQHGYNTDINARRYIFIYLVWGFLLPPFMVLYIPYVLVDQRRAHKLMAKVIELIEDGE